MRLIGRERVVEENGRVVLDRGWLLSLKRRGWCWWHHSNEAGARCIQIWFLILEMWHHDSRDGCGE